MTGAERAWSDALTNARAACDRACDELTGALALEPLPVVVRCALAAALRQVAEAQGVVEATRAETRIGTDDLAGRTA